MSIYILQTGLLTTVQDRGRQGYRSFGINPNGVMDTIASTLVNYLVGNDASEGVIEFHFPMGEIELQQDALVAFGGADFGLKADDKPLDNWKPHYLSRGTRIKATAKPQGARLYMAVQGGFQLEKWHDSVSTNLKARTGGYKGRNLQKADILSFKSIHPFSPSLLTHSSHWGISLNTLQQLYRTDTVRIIAGPEWDMLTQEAKEIVQSQEFLISSFSDRMGYRLEGIALEREDATELVSSAVTKGTIQLLPSGQLIVLMADHQTTGGYPRIATVIGADLSGLAQRSTHDKIHFSLVSVEQAEEILLTQHREFEILRFAIHQKL
ncbi:biotin-dependent carboxyltransferase family protein [Cytophagaceae bacterium YF14B1]|uniref:Biotin-dependent carboxyltransferase family protein n=1 Tax=Xanthocytophaga flava TaxID=3048013 RepID=A0AAE3U813_9BACT|nr:biotin-dependent carboxyltransferase family protein [Xanthocytophaga flavus]MDJ1480184.1 biotin-dependent carboxyltransferase family protein [Xanthocytophaga flavus]